MYGVTPQLSSSWSRQEQIYLHYYIFYPFASPLFVSNTLIAEIFLPSLKYWVNSYYLLVNVPHAVPYKTFNSREMFGAQDIPIMP